MVWLQLYQFSLFCYAAPQPEHPRFDPIDTFTGLVTFDLVHTYFTQFEFEFEFLYAY